MPSYLYLDIETIPATEAETIAEIAANVTPPASMKKQETIAKWEAEEKPKAVAAAVAKTSFNGAHGKVCCIGWAWDNDAPHSLGWGSSLGRDERTLLSYFADSLQETRRPFDRPMVVGHYVAGFDLRFLWQRAFALGVKMPAWFPRDPKPWSDEVQDTMHMWSGAKDTISLDDLCKALGIPGKGDINGADVAGMWQRGEHNAIAEYCRMDVVRVRNCHQRMLIAYGEAA